MFTKFNGLWIGILLGLLLAGCQTAAPTPSSTATLAPVMTLATTVTPFSSTPTPSGEMHTELNIPYAGAAAAGDRPELRSLDVYAPAAPGSYPVMVMIHGGAWSSGDKSDFRQSQTKADFFTALGWVFVSINYRLSPQVMHPAHVQDVASALAWISDNIARYSGNPQRMFIMGHSAGAHLAALVATDEQYLQQVGKHLADIKGVILLDGAGYDLPRAMVAGDGLEEMYLTAFGSDPQTWRDASPLFHVAAGKGIPPFLLFNAGPRQDTFVFSDSLAEALRAAGVEATLVTAPTKNHNTLNYAVGLPNDETTVSIQAFLAGH